MDRNEYEYFERFKGEDQRPYEVDQIIREFAERGQDISHFTDDSIMGMRYSWHDPMRHKYAAYDDLSDIEYFEVRTE